MTNVDPTKIIDVYQAKKNAIESQKSTEIVNLTMKITHEGKDKVFDLTHIKQKERTIVENKFFYSVIPILINKDKLRIVSSIDQNKIDLEIEYKNSSLNSVFDNEVIKYIESVIIFFN